MDIVQIFVAYSREDTDMLGQLVPHLSVLERTKIVDRIWFDGKIEPGEDWNSEIKANLENSDIILLLISANFLASEYCYSIEMKKAIQLHEKKQAIVLPIILKSCIWGDTPFAKIQALPKDAKPINSWLRKDEAFSEVTQTIKEKAIDVKNRKDIQIKKKYDETFNKFNEILKKSESEFNLKEWRKSLTFYKQAKEVFIEGFEPELNLINEKINSCEFELNYEKVRSQAIEKYIAANYVAALNLFQECQKLKKDDEIEKIVEECRKFSHIQKLILEQENKLHKIRKELLDKLNNNYDVYEKLLSEQEKSLKRSISNISKKLIGSNKGLKKNIDNSNNEIRNDFYNIEIMKNKKIEEIEYRLNYIFDYLGMKFPPEPIDDIDENNEDDEDDMSW